MKKILTGLLAIMITLITLSMAYSTNTDLVNSTDERSIIQLVDDANTGLVTLEAVQAEVADPGSEYQIEAQKMIARMDLARSNADETINTFLRTQYDVPLSPVPAMVSSLSIDLTIHNLYQRRMRTDMPDDIKALEKDALGKLKMIQQGTIKLVDKPDVASGQIVVNKTRHDKIWPSDLLDKF